jgi:hypothetical protein
MHPFKHFFVFEFKRFLTIRNLIIALLFFATAMYFVIDGVSQYRENQDNKSKFVEIEKSKVEKHQYYTQYGGYGFRIYYDLPKLSIFFYNSGLFSQLNAIIDVGERLNIYNSYKGKELFKERSGTYADFSGLMVLIGTLIVLFYGFESLRNTGYLKMLTALLGRRRLFFNIIAARFLIISLFFFLAAALGVLLVLLSGIVFSFKEYLLMAVFFGIWLLSSLFFFLLGTTIGRIISVPFGIAILVVTWIGLVYQFPIIVNKITSISSNNIATNYQLEIKKWDEMMNFEKKVIEKQGKRSIKKEITEAEKIMVERFMDEGYNKIKKIEKGLEAKMEKNIRLFKWLSILSPITTMSSVNAELSGKGYESSLAFFRYIQDLKDKFCLFYKQKKFYSNDEKVESFIRHNENIYNAFSRLPGNTGWGILLTFILTLILFKISYSLFNSGLFALDARGLKDIDDTDLTINTADNNTYYSKYVIMAGLLFALLSGEQKQLARKGFKGKIRLVDIDIVSQSIPGGFFYAPPIESIPGDIKAVDLIRLIAGLAKLTPDERDAVLKQPDVKNAAGKRFENMKKHEKAGILLTLSRAVNTDIYFFYDIAVGLDSEFAKKLSERINELTAAGKLAFYLTTDDYVRSKKSDGTDKKKKTKAKKIYRLKNWTEYVDALNEKIEINGG